MEEARREVLNSIHEIVSEWEGGSGYEWEETLSLIRVELQKAGLFSSIPKICAGCGDLITDENSPNEDTYFGPESGYCDKCAAANE